MEKNRKIKMKSPAEFKTALEKIKMSIQSAGAVYGQEDLENSLLLTLRALHLISDFSESMADVPGAPDPVLADQTKFFNQDLTRLKSIALDQIEINPGIDEAEFPIILQRLDRYADQLEHATQSLFPAPHRLKVLAGETMRHAAHLWSISPVPVRWIAGSAVFLLVLTGVIGMKTKYENEKKHGLIGEYYSDREFKNFIQKRKDPNINFTWKRSGPTEKMKNNSNFFSIRWTGFLDVPTAGSYVFSSKADDGIRVWINDALIIDHADWSRPVSSSPIPLGKGLQPIKIEYFESEGLANVSLSWRGENDFEDKIIASDFFFPAKPADR